MKKIFIIIIMFVLLTAFVFLQSCSYVTTVSEKKPIGDSLGALEIKSNTRVNVIIEKSKFGTVNVQQLKGGDTTSAKFFKVLGVTTKKAIDIAAKVVTINKGDVVDIDNKEAKEE